MPVNRTHTTGYDVVLILSFGDRHVIDEILKRPGTSEILLEAVAVYCEPSLARRLGGLPDEAGSESVARAMAMAALVRARHLSDAAPDRPRGIGATIGPPANCSQNDLRQVHVAWQSAQRTIVRSCVLRSCADEQLVVELISAAMAEACGSVEPVMALSARHSLHVRDKQALPHWSGLLVGERDTAFMGASENRPVLFPGAFHPLHDGHRHGRACRRQVSQAGYV
jgi:hypothetical protein